MKIFIPGENCSNAKNVIDLSLKQATSRYISKHTLRKDHLNACNAKKKFAREQILKSHMKIHAKRTRDNKCPMCPKAFFDKAGLRNHTHKVHDNEKRSAFMEKKYVWAGAFFYRFQVRS